MPSLPDIPLEIWLQIFEFACTDSGLTSRSLAQTSRYLRLASRSFRFHTVAINGWRQLLAFEEQFARAPIGTRCLKHLYVHMPEMYTDAYPPESWFEEEEEDVDSTYVPSDDDDDEDEEEEGEEVEVEEDAPAPEELVDRGEGSSTNQTQPPPDDDDDDDARSSTSSETSLTPSSLEELTLDSPTLAPTDLTDLTSDCTFLSSPSGHPSVPPIHGQDLSVLSSTYLRLAQLEHRVFTSLHRVLALASHSLRAFTLCWSPSASVHLEAVVPRLPELRYLAILKDTIPSEDCAPGRYKFHLKRASPAPVLFPALETLKVGTGASKKHFAWDDDAFNGLLNEPLRSVSAPARLIKSLTLPPTLTHLTAWGPARRDEPWGRLTTEHVLEHLYPTHPSRWSPTAVYVRETGMESAEEFREDWMVQVVEGGGGG